MVGLPKWIAMCPVGQAFKACEGNANVYRRATEFATKYAEELKKHQQQHHASPELFIWTSKTEASVDSVRRKAEELVLEHAQVIVVDVFGGTDLT